MARDEPDRDSHKGPALGLISADQTLTDDDVMQLVLEPVLIAGALTQQAGGGVGMDVVATEIKKLGGARTCDGVGQAAFRLPRSAAGRPQGLPLLARRRSATAGGPESWPSATRWRRICAAIAPRSPMVNTNTGCSRWLSTSVWNPLRSPRPTRRFR